MKWTRWQYCNYNFSCFYIFWGHLKISLGTGLSVCLVGQNKNANNDFFPNWLTNIFDRKQQKLGFWTLFGNQGFASGLNIWPNSLLFNYFVKIFFIFNNKQRFWEARSPFLSFSKIFTQEKVQLSFTNVKILKIIIKNYLSQK